MTIAKTPFWELLMAIVRVQPLIRSGKALLTFRNGLEDSVTVTSVLASVRGGPNAEEKWVPLLPAPIQLRAGQIESTDISSAILKLFKPSDSTSAQNRQIRLRVILDPLPAEQPKTADYSIAFHGSNFIKFSTC